jgi:hypothetical protein
MLRYGRGEPLFERGFFGLYGLSGRFVIIFNFFIFSGGQIDSSRTAQELSYIHKNYDNKLIYQKITPDIPGKKMATDDSKTETEAEGKLGGVGGESDASELDLGRSAFKMICSAVIYDDLLRQVRIWIRMGYAPQDIQNELDQRYSAIYDVHDEIEEDLEMKKSEDEAAEKNKSK